MNRKELYNIIKVCNLAEDIKETFGRNYTQVSTEDLQNYIEKDKEEEEDTPNTSMIVLYDYIKFLTKERVLIPKNLESLAELLAELAARVREVGV